MLDIEDQSVWSNTGAWYSSLLSS